MNNLKKAGVMFLIAAMVLGALIVPFTPMTQVHPVATPQISTPESVMMDIQRYLGERKAEGPLDSVLASYRDGGELPSDVITTYTGDVAVIMVLDEFTDVASLAGLITVNWKVKVGAATIVHAYIAGPGVLTQLEKNDGVVSVFADRYVKQPFDDATDVLAPGNDAPDQYATVPWIGVDSTFHTDFPSIDGTGVRVGLIDTGTDFSQPDLVDAADIGPDGISTSFDSSGYGTVLSMYRVNATVVENVTAWFQYSSWNLLSYQKDGKWYINGTYPDGSYWDPHVNNQNFYDTVDYFVDHYINDIWWGTQPGGYPNAANLTEYYRNVIRQDLEIPDPTLAMGGGPLNYSVGGFTITNPAEEVPYYCAGYAFQQRLDPYTKVFAPVLVLNGTTVIVDWNTTRAHSQFWMDSIFLGRYSSPVDFNVTANRDKYANMGDWSFVDDWNAGKWYGNSTDPNHQVMYNDYPDGKRFGLGTLAATIESIGFGFGHIGPIALGGRMVGIMYDGDSHGTFTAGEIAGRGIEQYPVMGAGDTLTTMPGVAPGSTISACQSVGLGGIYTTMLWTAGFDPVGASTYMWNNESTHQMDITSNSWGWGAPQYIELWGVYSLIYAAIATPGFFDPQYPGMVQCFSAGNSGPGYGTATPPAVPQLITVGASTSYHPFEDAYGPGQGFDQVAAFSSRGPLTLGYPKVDVLAPGLANYGIVPDYGDFFYGTSNGNYAVYGGTSMACPMVAGTAALMLQANPSLTPDDVKAIIESTAVDVGADGLSQGAGRVDAYAAVDYAANNVGYVFSNTDSAANWADATAEAWDYDLNPYTRNTFFNESTHGIPDSFVDYNLYFGLVNIGDSVTMTVNTDGNWAYGDFTWSAEQYVAGPTYTFSYETSIYNETTSAYPLNATTPGWIDLQASLGTTDFNTLMGYQFATISIAGDQATFEDNSLWAYIFDWSDTDPNNLRPDFYNGTNGDELSRIQEGRSSGNVLKMDLSSATTLADLFSATPIILVHDDNIMSWPYTGGNMLDVTVQPWTLAPDPNVATPVTATQGANVTLTVGAGTDYGIHQGFVIADGYRMPYTYNVIAPYAENDTIMEVANGYGDVQTPYEHGQATAGYSTTYTYTSADHPSFVVNVSDADVNYLAARLQWTNPDTDMDVDIADMTGWALAESYTSVDESDTSVAAVAAIGGYTGLYIIYVYVNALEGTTIPEDFVLTVIGFNQLKDPTLELTWTSRTSSTPTPITSGGSAAGDHVVMNTTWYDAVNPGLPEYGVTTMGVRILYGTLFEKTGPTHPSADPGADQGGGAIHPDYYEWVVAPDIVEGDHVVISVGFDGSDCDVWVWWNDIPMSERTLGNMISTDGISGANPEVIKFTADQSGSLAIGIEDYAGDSTTYECTVDTRVGLEPAPILGHTISIDTYGLEFNGTFAVLVESDSGTNVVFKANVPDIFIGNFLPPVVTVNPAIDIGGNAFNFTWSTTDKNANDSFYYSVYYSRNGGALWQQVINNLTDTFLVWNSTGFIIDDYIYKVRAYDQDIAYGLGDASSPNPPVSYWPGNYGEGISGEFTAGTIVYTPPTTTTTTTTTTPPPTTTTPPPVTIDPLLIGLLGGIGVGVVVLLILFLIRKR